MITAAAMWAWWKIVNNSVCFQDWQALHSGDAQELDTLSFVHWRNGHELCLLTADLEGSWTLAVGTLFFPTVCIWSGDRVRYGLAAGVLLV